MIENPMVRPLSTWEEDQFLSDEDIEDLPTCSWCGCKVSRKYKRTDMHPDCWQEGKAESLSDR